MFVELLGLPAAGKSTLLKNCSQQARKKGYQIGTANKLDDADVSMAGFLHRTPVPRALYRYEALRRKHPEFFSFIDDLAVNALPSKALLLATALRQEIYCENPECFDMVFVDEGCIHRGIHMILKQAENPETATDNYSTIVPAPDAIIYLELSPEQSHKDAVARLTNRDRGKSKPENILRRINAAHGDVKILQKRKELMERVITHMEDKGVPVIRIPARDDLKKNAQNVTETLSVLKSKYT